MDASIRFIGYAVVEGASTQQFIKNWGSFLHGQSRLIDVSRFSMRRRELIVARNGGEEFVLIGESKHRNVA